MLIPTTGPLHKLFPLPGMPFSQMFALFRCQLREAFPDHPLPLPLTPLSFLSLPSLYFNIIFFFFITVVKYMSASQVAQQ